MNPRTEDNLKRFHQRFDQDHAALRTRLLSDLADCPPANVPGSGAVAGGLGPVWLTRCVLVVAAVILLALFLWPPSTTLQQRTQSSASLWAADAQAALQQVKVNGVRWHEKTIFILPDGTQHESSTTSRIAMAADRYRRDLYEAGQLRETQWYTPANDGMTQTSVCFDTKTYLVLQHNGNFGQMDPLQRAQLLVNMLDKADRQLAPIDINGHKCPGFEIRANRYGDNPDEWFDRIWFDPQTKLPVRVERHGRRTSNEPKLSLISVQEQFDPTPDLRPDTFSPQIPPDFANAADPQD